MSGRLLDRILELSSLLQHDMQRAFAGTTLSESRVHLLWVLQHVGPSTQQALAESLQVTPRSISSLVDGLATTGYVDRRPHPADRRAVLVALTPAAEDMMSRMAADHAQLTNNLENVIDDTDKEAFFRALDAVTSHLRQLVQGNDVHYGLDERPHQDERKDPRP